MSNLSITKISNKTWKTFKRFPLTIFCSVLAVTAAAYLVEVEIAAINSSDIAAIIMVSVLGISLLTAVSLITEKKDDNLFFLLSLYFI